MDYTAKQLTDMAAFVQVNAMLAEASERTNGNAGSVPERYVDEMMGKYSWVKDYFPLFSEPAAGSFDDMISYFDNMVAHDFELPATTKADVPKGFAEDRFAELEDLSLIIYGSHGKSFDAFARNVLLPMDTVWLNQAAVAKALSGSAKAAHAIYVAGRGDLMGLAQLTCNRLGQIGARESHSDPIIPYQSTILSYGSLVVGLAGLIPGIGIPATLVSAALGLGSMASEDAEFTMKPTKNHDFNIKGDTTEAIMDSLFGELGRLGDKMREAESKLAANLKNLHGLMKDERDNVEAPGRHIPG